MKCVFLLLTAHANDSKCYSNDRWRHFMIERFDCRRTTDALVRTWAYYAQMMAVSFGDDWAFVQLKAQNICVQLFWKSHWLFSWWWTKKKYENLRFHHFLVNKSPLKNRPWQIAHKYYAWSPSASRKKNINQSNEIIWMFSISWVIYCIKFKIYSVHLWFLG